MIEEILSNGACLKIDKEEKKKKKLCWFKGYLIFSCLFYCSVSDIAE